MSALCGALQPGCLLQLVDWMQSRQPASRPPLQPPPCDCSMLRPMAPEFGPDIEFREYSFLGSPQAAEVVKAALDLEVCQVRWLGVVSTTPHSIGICQGGG